MEKESRRSGESPSYSGTCAQYSAILVSFKRELSSQWFQVAAGEVLCDIETDKATLDLESMEDGFVLFHPFVTELVLFIFTEV